MYDNVRFTGGSATRAVLQIDSAAYDITFHDCTIAGGPWNGITINDSLGNIHDITFSGCHILTQKRMGLECTSRPISTTRGYHGIRVLGCTFEPQGSEAVSFDGGAGCKYNRVSGTVIKGAGVNPRQQWGAGFECNGPSSFTFTDNHVYQCRGPLLNLQRHVTAPSGWVFRNNVLNASVTTRRCPCRQTRRWWVASTSTAACSPATSSRLPPRAPAWRGSVTATRWTGTPPRGATHAGRLPPADRTGRQLRQPVLKAERRPSLYAVAMSWLTDFRADLGRYDA